MTPSDAAEFSHTLQSGDRWAHLIEFLVGAHVPIAGTSGADIPEDAALTLRHSDRSAVIGSELAARRAGR